MKYVPPLGSTDPNASYVNENLATGIEGSPVDGAAIEHPLRELDYLIKQGLGAGAPASGDLTQVHQAVKAMITAALGVKSTTVLVGSGGGDSGWSKVMTWSAVNGSRAVITLAGAAGYGSNADALQGSVVLCMTMGTGTHANNLSAQAYSFGGAAGVTGIKVKQGATAWVWDIYVNHGAFWTAVMAYHGTAATLPDFTGATSAAGAAPTGTVYDKTISTIYSSANLGAASPAAAGLVQLATAAQAQAGTEAAAVLTPATMLSTFANSQAISGYQKLPSGLIIQWVTGTIASSGTATVSFPIVFPNNIFKVVASAVQISGAGSLCVVSGTTTTSSVNIKNNFAGSIGADVIAIGN